MADNRRPITRRQFLAGSAAASLSAVLLGHDRQIGRLLTDLGGDVRGGSDVGMAAAGFDAAPLPSFTFSVERETDLVLLDFSFYGFEQVLTSGVVSLNPTGSANVIVVQFPPQSIGEAAYNYEGPSSRYWYVDPPPVLSAVSGPSRLCFTLSMESSVEFSTMTAADLLDWNGWQLLVPTAAEIPASHILPQTANVLLDDAPGFTPPPNPTLTNNLTYIEYPYGLFICPAISPEPASTRSLGSDATLTDARRASSRGSELGATLARPMLANPLGGSRPAVLSGRAQPLTSGEDVADCWTVALTAASIGSPAPGAAVWARDLALPPLPIETPPVPYGDNTPEKYLDYST